MATNGGHPNSWRRRWVPLCAARAEEVLAAVVGICEAIVDAYSESADFTLADGHAGLAVLFAHAAPALAEQDYGERARGHLGTAVRLCNAAPRIELSLFQGVAGIGWAATHMPGGDETLDVRELDALVLRVLARPPRSLPYELIDGLAGLAAYALERAGEPAWRQALEGVVSHFAGAALNAPPGLTWFTDPNTLPPGSQSAARCPGGLYNLGMAHGVAGVVSLLAGLAERGIGGAVTPRLLAGGAAWLAAQRRCSDGGEERWPVWIDHAGVATVTPATWWCYGEPGIATALLRAAAILEDGALARTARAMLRAGARRAARCPGDADLSLCHGAAGMAQMCARAYSICGDESLAAEALHWYERLLSALERPKAVTAAMGSGLLTGTAGIALALLGGVSGTEPAWDKALLLS